MGDDPARVATHGAVFAWTDDLGRQWVSTTRQDEDGRVWFGCAISGQYVREWMATQPETDDG